MRRQGRGLYDAAEVSRLNDIISGCDSPEEALVKRCSLFSTDDILDDYDDFVSSGDEEQEGTAPRRKLGTGNTILDIRYKELKDLGADLQTKFRQGFWLRARIDPEIKTHFDKTLKLIESSNAAGELGDNLVRRMLRKCLDFAKSHAKKRDGEHFYVTAQMVRLKLIGVTCDT